MPVAVESLTFLTWNLAMLERPSRAPMDWTEENTQAEVRRIALELSPDVVTFQELPGVVPYVDTHDMVRANPRSHQGNLATLVGNHLVDDGQATVEGAAATVIAGCAVLTTVGPFVIANVHLAPGRGGAEHRLDQLSAIVEAAGDAPLVVVGDGNARVAEEAAIARLGLHGPRPPKPTWDSVRNRFRLEDDPDDVGRFGDGNAGFVAHFTRCWATADVRIDGLTVLDEPIVVDGPAPVYATDELDGRPAPFHLSDHFGLAGTISHKKG